MKLSRRELMRYSRQIMLDKIGEPGQKKLKNASVLCVGAGGIGSPALLYLAAAGVGTIGIIDHDVVELSNLHRQILFSEKDIDKRKSEVSLEALINNNSDIKYISYPEKLTTQNVLNIFADYDVIIDASDNFQCKYLTNDASKHLGIPLVLASVYQFTGQLSVFNYKGGPCYRCLYPSPTSLIPNCADAGVLGVIPGIIGTMAASEVLKIILEIGATLSECLMTFDALSFVVKKMKLEKSALCLTCHNQEVNIKLPHDPSISPHDLLKLMQSNKQLLIIDVREPWEMATYSIAGCKNIPLKQIPDFSPEKNVTIIFCCKTGYRSAQAARILINNGHNNILSLEGGVTKWAKDIDKKELI